MRPSSLPAPSDDNYNPILNSHLHAQLPSSQASSLRKLQYLASAPPEPRLKTESSFNGGAAQDIDSNSDTDSISNSSPKIQANMDVGSSPPSAFVTCVPLLNGQTNKSSFHSTSPLSVHPPNVAVHRTPSAPSVALPIVQQQQQQQRAETVKKNQDFHGIPNPLPGEKLTLNDLRERLIRQEETIIFALIERAQFSLNDVIYEIGAFPDLPSYPLPHSGGELTVSFSQYMLYELERVHSAVRRYTSPDEHAFAPAHLLSQPVLSKLAYPSTLIENDINRNVEVDQVYRRSILPSICVAGDDGNYGSSATCDAACLQALSKRIHYGKFIAEAKCQGDEETYERLAKQGDKEGIWKLLTNMKVENVLLKRVENKARNYGSEVTNDGPRTQGELKVEPTVISNLYRDFIIPLTKEVEVDYILYRYNGSVQ